MSVYVALTRSSAVAKRPRVLRVVENVAVTNVIQDHSNLHRRVYGVCEFLSYLLLWPYLTPLPRQSESLVENDFIFITFLMTIPGKMAANIFSPFFQTESDRCLIRCCK